MGVEGMRSILEDCCSRDAVAETQVLITTLRNRKSA